ncbi:MAG: hypothetical protein KAR05_00425 [Candidatus Omnitrophica bacterium]|nr:hypothetical protein [Candidatus Omnitrophota bacterium]
MEEFKPEIKQEESEMRKTFLNLILTILIILGLITVTKDAVAETLVGDYLKEKGVDVEVSASMDFYSKYVWRGFLLDDDCVLQPGFTISAAGFESGFWGSWDVDANDSLNSDEVDGWIGYSFDLGFIDEAFEMVGLSVGNTWYDFPGADLYTKELYVGITLDTLLSPYFTWYHDYGEEASGGADGNYYTIGAGHGFDLVENYGITLDVGSEVGFNEGAFIAGDGGYYLATLGLTVPLTETLTMSPCLGYSVPFGDLEDSSDGNQNEQFYGGVSLAFSF